jgi:hypothetical protein
MQTTPAAPSPENDPTPNPGQHPQPPGLPGQPGDSVQEPLQALYSLGFIAKEHYTFAQRLLANPPAEDFDRVVRLPAGRTREEHLLILSNLMRSVRTLDAKADLYYAQWLAAPTPAIAETNREMLKHIEVRLRALFPRFRFRWAAYEEMIVVANYFERKFQTFLAQGTQRDEFVPGATVSEAGTTGPAENSPAGGVRKELSALEAVARMPAREFCEACARLQTAIEAALLGQPSRSTP